MKITPLWKNVLITPSKQAEMSEGGIALPENKTKSEMIEGRVEAVADQVTEVLVGDTVGFDEFAGEQVEGKYLIHVEDLKYGKEVTENYGRKQTTSS